MTTISTKMEMRGDAQYRKAMEQITAKSKALASELKVVNTAFDKEDSAQAKAAARAEVLNKQIAVQNDKIKEISREYEHYSATKGEDDAVTLKWKTDLNNATAVLQQMEHELSDTQKVADGYSDEVEESSGATAEFFATTKKMEALERMSELMEKASKVASQFASSAIDAAKELDQGYDTIVKKTGATGEKLEELSAIANDIYGSMPESMENIGAAIGEVNTRLGLTGDDLQATSVEFLKFAKINNTDVSNSVDSVQKALAAFGLDASDTSRILGVMTAAGQDSGVSMDELASAMVKNAGALNELGLSAEQSIMFIGRLEKSGVDSETALSGMSRALKNATKQGIPLNQALEDLENTILNGTDDMDGLSASYDLFGKSGDKIYNAVKKGSISFKDLSGSVEDYGDIVERTYEATLSPWDKTQVAMQNVKRAGGELAKNALSVVEPAINGIGKAIESLAKRMEKAPKWIKAISGALAALLAGSAVVGPKVLSVVKAIEGFKIARQTAKAVDVMTAAQTTNAAAASAATEAQLGLNAAMLAVPVGIAVALIGIGTAASLYAWKTHEARSEQEEFSLGLRNLGIEAKNAADELSSATDNLEGVRSGATDTAADMEASAALARRYADELITLSEKSNRTAEEQRQMEAVLDSLKEIYPSFNASIDEATGNLSMNTDEINKNIDALEKQAKAQAYQEAYKEIIEGIVNAEKKKIKAQMKADDLAKQLASDTAAGTRFQEAFNKAVDEYVAQGMSRSKAEEKVRNGYVELNGELVRTTEAMKGVANAEGGVRIQQADLNKEMEKADEEIAAASEEAERYRQAAEELGIEIPGLTDAVTESGDAADGAADSYDNYAGSAEGAADAILTSSDEIVEAYDKEYESALGSIKGQSGLFDDLEESSTMSIETIRKNLEAHVQSLTDWNNNIQTLMSDARYGTDENYTAMVNYVVSAGQEMAPAVQGIVDAMDNGDADLQAVIDGFGNLADLDPQIAEATATATVSMQYGMETMQTAADTGMQQTEQTIDQNSAMMQRNIGTYGNQWSNASKASGGKIPRGIKIGVDANTGLATGAVSALGGLVNGTATTAFAAAQKTGKTEGGKFSSETGAGISEKEGEVSSAASSLASSAKDELNGMYSAGKTGGENFGSGVISGINSKVEQVASKARALADAANRAYNDKLDIKSPSRVMMRSGRYTAEGVALGIEQGIPMVERASESLALASENMFVDPDLISGRSGLAATIQRSISGINADMIYDAIVQGMNGVKFQIDRREFQRILHDVGVATA